jgi:N-methylhydantoinase B
MAFPGGAGYGDPTDRPKELVKRDLARGYIGEDTAKNAYGLTAKEIAAVLTAVENGENV